MRVVDPGHAFERPYLVALRHDAQNARIDVPSGHRHRHVARAFAELLHHRTRARRIVFDAGIEVLEVRPRFFPPIHRVLRVLVAQNVRQTHDERAAGAGIGGPRVDQTVGIGFAPRQQLRRRGRYLLDLVGVVFEQRPRWHEDHGDAVILCQLLHLRGGGLIVAHEVREFCRVFWKDLHQHALLDPRGEKVSAGQHQVDVTAARTLHGLELPRQFRRRRLGEVDLRNHLRVFLLVGLDGVLRERQVTGDVDDIDRHRALRHRGSLRGGGPGSQYQQRRRAERRRSDAQRATAGREPGRIECLA